MCIFLYNCIYSHVHFHLNFTFSAAGKPFGKSLGISMVVCLDTDANGKCVIFILVGFQFLSFLVILWQTQHYLKTPPIRYTFWSEQKFENHFQSLFKLGV